MKRVLFVCMGNICRSPTAEVVFQHKVTEAGLGERILVESAGTHAYHVGHGADPRSRKAAKRRGYDLAGHRAKRVASADYEHFDHVIAMDHENMSILRSECPKAHRAKLSLFLAHAEGLEVEEVPDPYYGEGWSGFEHVLDLVEAASEGLLAKLRRELGA